MIGCAFERNSRGAQTAQRFSQRGAGWVKERRVIEARGAERGRRTAKTFERIERDVICLLYTSRCV